MSWGSRSPTALTLGDERLETLERRLREVAALASAGKLPGALITEAGLSISPIRQNDTDVDDIARRLYGMLPRTNNFGPGIP